jgi:hypothetical protein
MKAIVRRDLIERGDYPPSSIEVSSRDWDELEFEFWLIQGYNATQDGDFEEGYDLILVHPRTGKLFWSYSIDFSFDHSWQEREVAV